MTEFGPAWSSVSLSNVSAVTFVGSWNADATTSFHNVSYPDTPTSVAFTFHGGFPIHSFRGGSGVAYQLVDYGLCLGTRARAVGFMTFNDSPLYGWIAPDSEGPYELMEPLSYNQCNDDPIFEPCPSAFYVTEILPCNQHTLHLIVMQDQAMQIKEFDFIPCTSDDDQASASVSTTALTSPSSPSSAVAAEKQQKTLGAGTIVGAVLGAMAFLALSSLAFFIFLRRSHRHRHHRGPQPSPPPPPSSSSSSPFLISFLRSRPWLRLSGPQPKISTSSTEFLTAPVSFSLPAAAAGDGSGGSGAGGKTGHWSSTTLLDAPAAHSGSPFPSAAPETTGLAAPMLPWMFDSSAEYNPRDGYAIDGQQQQPQQYARDREWGEMVEKQPLRHDNADLDSGGLAVAHGYLPESKELMALQEREQLGAPPRTPETLPLYQVRDSLQWP